MLRFATILMFLLASFPAAALAPQRVIALPAGVTPNARVKGKSMLCTRNPQICRPKGD